jgi:hypothetical protein
MLNVNHNSLDSEQVDKVEGETSGCSTGSTSLLRDFLGSLDLNN